MGIAGSFDPLSFRDAFQSHKYPVVVLDPNRHTISDDHALVVHGTDTDTDTDAGADADPFAHAVSDSFTNTVADAYSLA